MMALPETFLSETRRLLGDETADGLFRALESDVLSGMDEGNDTTSALVRNGTTVA